MDEEVKVCPTHEVKIYIGGDIHTIEAVCRKFCLVGLCVTVTPTNFIFTGGSESGACVGLINYARFPVHGDAVNSAAHLLAGSLMRECCQRTCTVIDPKESHYLENAEIKQPR